MSDDVIDADFHSTPLSLRDDMSSMLARPVMSADAARDAMAEYLKICAAVLTADDYQTFLQWDSASKSKIEKRFKKKSAVKKLQTFWGVSVKIRDVQRDAMDDGHFGFRCIATARTRDGREVESTGACSTYEDRFTPERQQKDDDAWFAKKSRAARARAYHDVLSTAETRATNRAVMNCIGVGGGEVTADELQGRGSKSGGSDVTDAQKVLEAKVEDARKYVAELPKKLHDARRAVEDIIEERALTGATVTTLLAEMTDGKVASWQALDLPGLRNFARALKAWAPPAEPAPSNGHAEVAAAEAVDPGDTRMDDLDDALLDVSEPPIGPAPLPDGVLAYTEKELKRLGLSEDAVMELAREAAVPYGFVTYDWKMLATPEIAKQFIEAARAAHKAAKAAGKAPVPA